MRILIAVSSLGGGGAERMSVHLARGWAAQGHDVRVLTLAAKADGDYPLPPEIDHQALDLAHGEGGLLHRLTGNLRSLGAHRRAIQAFRPDVVLGMMARTNVTVALAAAGLGCTVVGAERSSPGHSPLPWIWRAARWWAYGELDLVTAQTEGAAAWLRANTRARRVSVIPNAVSLPLAPGPRVLRPESVLPPERRVLLGVGRLAPVKQFHLLVDSFARVARRHPGWDLVVVGEGLERRRLERRIAGHGLEGRVFLPGRADNMGDWYARASIVGLTSQHEGFPNALLEAMAHGVPAVAMDCPHGPRAIIRHGTDGLLTPPDDADAMGEQLDRLLGDDHRRSALASAAREVLDRFSDTAVMRLWEDAIGLDRPARRPALEALRA